MTMTHTVKSEDRSPQTSWLKIGLTIDIPRDPQHTLKSLDLSKQMTATGAAKRYIASIRKAGWTKLTVRQYERVLNILIREFQYTKVSELDRVSVDKFLRRVHGSVKAITYAHYSRIYWQYFEFCRQNNYCLYNWVRKFSLIASKKTRFYLPKQVELIFKELPQGETRDACLLIYHTGIDVHDLNNITLVNRAQGVFVVDGRTVRYPRWLDHIDIGSRWSVDRIAGEFRELLQRLELPGDLRFMQNTWVARAAAGGTPLPVIQAQTGLKTKRGAQFKVERVLRTQRYRELIDRIPYKDFT